ncbi:probable cytochrome P450 313a2 [Drosophila takahashii]|uniref:probable cytochrome P450 313a2 n=1 Tax=Drosophila takahashii TaxID=29030 RepID=UPI00389964F4
MISVQLLIVAVILFWIHFLWSRRHLYLLSLKLPGTWGLPIIGIAIECFLFYKRKIRMRSKYLRMNGSTILTWLGTMPFVLTMDPKTAEDIFMSSSCVNRNWQAVSAFTHSFGHGLLTLQGSKWMERRKHMNVAFKPKILLSFLPIFNDEARSLVSLFDSFVSQGEKDVLPDLLKWSFRISAQTTMGTNVKEEKNLKNDTIMENFKTILNLITINTLMPFFKIKMISKLFGLEKRLTRAYSPISEMMDNIINKKLHSKPEITYNSESEMKIVVDKAIELFRKGEISFMELKSECNGMVVASFETTAHTVYHTLVLLAMHPECQERVFNEIKELLPTAEDLEITNEDLQKLVYLDRVLNEALRLIPSIPIITRDTMADLPLSNGVIVPKGVMIGVDIFSIHRNKDFWGPEAEKFNPDNFLPEKVSNRHPYAFIPFAKGKRNCIGWRYGLMSAKLALVKILTNYELSTSFRYEDLDFVDNMVINLVKSPRLAFQRR